MIMAALWTSSILRGNRLVCSVCSSRCSSQVKWGHCHCSAPAAFIRYIIAPSFVCAQADEFDLFPIFAASRYPKQQISAMSLVSGPGRAARSTAELQEDLTLHVQKHIDYIQSLDTVCRSRRSSSAFNAHRRVAKRRA